MHPWLAEADQTVSATLFYWVVAGLCVGLAAVSAALVKSWGTHREDLLTMLPCVQSCEKTLEAVREFLK